MGLLLLGGTAVGCAQLLGADWGGYEGGEAPGGGGQGGGTGGIGGQGGGCVDALADCPAIESECVEAACVEGACGERNVAAGTPTVMQPVGVCVGVQCDGDGGTMEVPLPAQTPCTEGGGKLCDEAGVCVECLSGVDCASGACGNARLCVTCGAIDVPAHPPSCQDGLDLASRGETLTTTSTIAFVVGVVGVGAGLALVLTAPGAPRSAALAPAVLPGGGGALLHGRF